jgi:retron-type reverse transcriptase
MSYDLSRRSGRTTRHGLAGAHDRQVRVPADEGSYRDILRRHEAECSRPNQTDAERRRLHAQTPTLLTDERVLMAAMDALSEDGPKAPGPDGICLHDLDRHHRWDLARQLRDLLRDGNYRHGRTRKVKIPKVNGTGTRTLEIPNLADQIVQKAAALVLQPLLDSGFDPWSFGFRPHRGREDALATVQLLVGHGGFPILLAEDLANAFTTVPHARLLQVLQRYGVHDETVNTVRRTICHDGNRGLPQGGSLSPLLLNAYLDHYLDRPWRRQMPHLPLIRYADDLCVLCRSGEEARQAHARLQSLTRPTGMRLKGCPETAIHDLGTPDAKVDWLGYQLSSRDGRIAPELTERLWSGLDDHLQRTHREPYASVAAYNIILGWVDQLGICLPRENLSEASYQRIVEMAIRNGFEEVPGLREIESTRARAVRRFQETQQIVLRGMSAGTTGGSADQYRDAAHTGRTSGAPTGAGTTHAPGSAGTLPAEFWIWTDGACLPRQRCGGWAYIVEDRSLRQPRMCRSGATPKTTNNRMELMAVIEALRSLTGRQQIRLFTDPRSKPSTTNRKTNAEQSDYL